MNTTSDDAAMRYRRKARNTWILVGSMFAINALGGFAGGFAFGTDPMGRVAPAAAIGLCALVVLVTAVAVFAHWRTDEHERHLDRIAFAIGGAVVITAYPAWFLLSLGDWVGSPHALGLWVLTVTVMLGVFAMLKVRHLVA